LSISVHKTSHKTSGAPAAPVVKTSAQENRAISATHEDRTTLRTSVISSQVSESAPPASVPDPSQNVDQRGAQLESLFNHEDQIRLLAERGDSRAQALLSRMEQYRSEYTTLQEQDLLPSGDVDGDGIANKDDVDADGDTLTNDFERQIGTDPYNPDTDRDGLIDWAETAIANDGRISLPELDGYQGIDALNPDSNHNGVVDGEEIPAEIMARYRLPSDGVAPAGPSETVTPQSANLLWTTPSTNAVRPQWGQTIGGNQDVVLTVNGDATLREENGHLGIATAQGTITIEDYQTRKIYVQGRPGNLTLEGGLNSSSLRGFDTNNDGVIDQGIQIASTGTATVHVDPFQGNMPTEPEVNGETIYNADTNGDGVGDASGTFTVPDEIDGQTVKAVAVMAEGSDVIVALKATPEGQTLKTFRIKNGKGPVENFAIDFNLGGTGKYFSAEKLTTKVTGSNENDFITAKAGSQILGLAGSDVLEAIGTGNGTVIDGGEGNDFIRGSDGNDTLRGGTGGGWDLIDAGYGSDNADGGAGDDIISFSDNGDDPTTHLRNDQVQGGAGNDLANALDIDPQTSSIEVNTGYASFVNFLGRRKDGASQALLNELLKAGKMTEQAFQSAATTMGQVVRDALSQKEAERYSDINGTSNISSGDTPPPKDNP